MDNTLLTLSILIFNMLKPHFDSRSSSYASDINFYFTVIVIVKLIPGALVLPDIDSRLSTVYGFDDASLPSRSVQSSCVVLVNHNETKSPSYS